MKAFVQALVGMFLVVGATSTSLAQVALPNSLSLTMKAMSADMKKIALQAKDASKNASSAILADDFTKLVEHSKSFVPETISSLPASQRPARAALYQQMLDETAASGHALAEAFRANDNVKAVALVKQLAQDKSNGHAEFRKND